MSPPSSSSEPPAPEDDSGSLLSMLGAAEELAQLGAFVWDRATGRTSGSAGLRAILGTEPGRVQSAEAALELIHPEDQKRVRRLAQLAVRGNEIQPTGFRLIREDGDAVHVVGRLRARLSDSGELLGVSGALMDVTDRRELESQLLQSQKMEAIGTLAGGVAHDFNNFLQVIAGHTDLIRMVPGVPEKVSRSIDSISSAIERCTQLTQRLLAFGRKQESAPTRNDVRALVQSASHLLTRLIGDDVELKIAADPDPCTIRIDPVQFEQVIVNLAVNARDAMPEGGALSLGVERVVLDAEAAQAFGLAPGAYCRLRAVDDGVGMTEEVSRRIFEPFFTTKPVGSGTGLGLSTVHGIVLQAGGAIRVESTPGSGTSFTLLFPAESMGPESTPIGVRATDYPKGLETILLVEDGDEVRSVTQQQLERAGYAVLAASNGEEAVRLAKAYPGDIHLMLSDVMMPKMSGPDVATALQVERPRMIVIFMSGYTERMVLRRTTLARDRVALQKPFAMRELLHCIRDALDTPRKHWGIIFPSSAL